MINTKYLIGAVIILLTLWGCGNDSDYIIESNPNEVAIFPVAMNLQLTVMNRGQLN